MKTPTYSHLITLQTKESLLMKILETKTPLISVHEWNIFINKTVGKKEYIVKNVLTLTS